MNRLEEVWLTFNETVVPAVALCAWAGVSFFVMTLHAEGSLSIRQMPNASIERSGVTERNTEAYRSLFGG